MATTTCRPSRARKKRWLLKPKRKYILSGTATWKAHWRNSVMIPAYDDPILWEGHASMVHEIKQQLPEGVKPDSIFCSVGGAGLIGGIMDGCKAVGWDDGKPRCTLRISLLTYTPRSAAGRCRNPRLELFLPVVVFERWPVRRGRLLQAGT